MLRHILYFGSLVSREQCHRDEQCSEAANNAQLDLLTHLVRTHVGRITAVCPRTFASFPTGKLVVGRSSPVELTAGLLADAPPYLNVGILKVVSQSLSILLRALQYRYRFGKPELVLMYNAFPGYAVPAVILATLWRTPLVTIVADINMPSLHSYSIRGILSYLVAWLVGRSHALIVFSAHTVADFGLTQPYLKYEPGVNAAEYATLSRAGSVTTDRHAIMYSGALIEASGFRTLLRAFELVNRTDCELWVTGRGDLQHEVEQAAVTNKKIRYFGFVDRKQLLELLDQASLLVNPRPSALPEHRYNFPSKLVQYLATGRPVITTITSDADQEYRDVVIPLDNETPEGLAETIRWALDLDQESLRAIGQRGRDFVLSHKTVEVMAEQVGEFLQRVVSQQ